jgi:hypothetical protein
LIFSLTACAIRDLELHQNAIEIERFWSQHLPPREHEKLLGHPFPALGRLQCSPGPTPDPAGIIGSFKNQFEISADRGKEIIEIVSDTTGQLTDDFHFLCLAQ